MQNLASSYVEWFAAKTRDNGELFYVVEEQPSTIELKEFIRDEIHEGYLPDDFKYKTLYYFLEAIAEGQTDYDYAVDYVGVDLNYPDLLAWLGSNSNRAEYANQALEEHHFTDIENCLRAAQYREIEEICSQTYSFLERQLETSLEADEEVEYE